jgi:dTDP-4-amino-4,6-dideoxyglucose formyltransferase
MIKILLLTDNEELLMRFKQLLRTRQLDIHPEFIFEYAFSKNNKVFASRFGDADWIRPIRIKDEVAFLCNEYDLIFSLHCKQIFPATLVNKVKCINIHPGLNPYNRGWYPQVFSIINNLPCGATIHEIDEQLDHGPVICQKQVRMESWDNSYTAYQKILDAEMDLLSENIENIITGNYKVTVKEEGNVNLKKDFEALCEINLNHQDTFQNHINLLRALSHGDYVNAFFIDDSGNKVYLKLELKNGIA